MPVLWGRRRRPNFLPLEDGSPLFLAGLWDRREKGGDGPLDSFAIVTSAAGSRVADVYDRMPVILDDKDLDLWLDPKVEDASRLPPLRQPRHGDDLTFTPVSTYVNHPRNDDPRCLEPVST